MSSTNTNTARPETRATDIDLLYNDALLRGKEEELIEAGLDGLALVNLDELKNLLEYHSVEKLVIGTHPGGFHADELVAISMISIIFDTEVEIIRSRDPEELKGCHFVVDTAEGLLDHHGARNDKISCAASRVYRLLYQTLEIRKAADWRFWNNLSKLVDDVARQDNGIKVFERFGYVAAMARFGVVHGEDMFYKAFQMVRQDMTALLYVWDAEADATAAALKVIEGDADDTVLVFDSSCRAANVKQLMWERRHPALYYISPEDENDWRILCAAPPRERRCSGSPL